MPTFDSNGLVTDSDLELREDAESKVYNSSAWGPTTNLGADKALGQIIDVPISQNAELQEVVQALYDAIDPASAEGVFLESICSITGITRSEATSSIVYLTVSGTSGTEVAAGKRARVPSGTIFATASGVTLPNGVPYAGLKATATTAGANEAGAEEITEIVDAVSGWNYVTNPSKATIGAEVETDSALRIRRKQNVYGIGSCNDIALKRALEELSSVTYAAVKSNRTLVTDADSIPAKSFLVVIHPFSEADEIAETIFNQSPAGILSYGDYYGSVTDEGGFTQTVRWSYATEIPIYWTVTVTKNANYPIDGDALVQAAVLAYGTGLNPSNDVLPIGAIDNIYDNVAGINHIVIAVGTSASPTSTTPVSILYNEISTHTAANIAVSSS